MNYPKEFLLALDAQREITKYARITRLTMNELPVETIEGRITGSGAINIDGASAVRRTCSLTMIGENLKINEYNWVFNTKFKLEIGIENKVDSSFDPIIWFKQGIYVINSFSASVNTTSVTINLNAKDKMCMLNGENGGALGAAAEFDSYDEIDKDGNLRKIKYPIKQIIRDLVHQMGGEPFHNIIVNDIPDTGVQLQTYRYDKPLYIWKKVGTNIFENCTLNGDQKVWVDRDTQCKISELQVFLSLNDLTDNTDNATLFYWTNTGEEAYQAARIDYGETAGYKEIPLTYPDTLSANIGESITSVLDKIKTMLGNFEYFYDLDGRFIFQKKPAYIVSDWSPTSLSKIAYEGTLKNQSYHYEFNNPETFISVSNNPNLTNLKNDFTIWGTKSSKLPIHMRYAIDRKPESYTSIAVSDEELKSYNEQYGLNVKGQESRVFIAKRDNQGDLTSYLSDQRNLGAEDSLNLSYSNGLVCDWREVIYRMALDYHKYNHLDDFALRVAAANPLQYPDGTTGYEQYYLDLEGFWRQLYSPEPVYKRVYNPVIENKNLYYIYDAETGTYTKLVPEGASETEGIVSDELTYDGEQWAEPAVIEDVPAVVATEEEEPLDLTIKYYTLDESFLRNGEWGWHINVLENPDQLLFWFDFLDMPNSEIDQYSRVRVGSRAKHKNDNTIKAIHYLRTPPIIFTDDIYGGQQSGYSYFNVEEAMAADMFSKSTQGKSAKEEIDDWLNMHSYCIESVNITAIPIYRLEPNTKIYINDPVSGIAGNYLLSKISVPLTYNGTMTLTAQKLVDNLL